MDTKFLALQDAVRQELGHLGCELVDYYIRETGIAYRTLCRDAKGNLCVHSLMYTDTGRPTFYNGLYGITDVNEGVNMMKRKGAV